MAQDPSLGMRKDERGAWVNRYREVLYVVTLEDNRFLSWARNAPAAINETIWQHYTRRQRKAPLATEAGVRSATDDEAAELLHRSPTRHTPVQRGQQSFDGVPRDPRLDRLLAESPGIVGSAHPATAKKAAAAVTLRTGTQRHAILSTIRNSQDGLTDEELQTWFRPNTQRPRRVELLQAGFIEAKGTRKTVSGQDAIIWVITADGKSALDACGA